MYIVTIIILSKKSIHAKQKKIISPGDVDYRREKCNKNCNCKRCCIAHTRSLVIYIVFMFIAWIIIIIFLLNNIQTKMRHYILLPKHILPLLHNRHHIFSYIFFSHKQHKKYMCVTLRSCVAYFIRSITIIL